MSNDARRYLFLSKTVFETLPCPQAFLDQRGPLYHPPAEGEEEGQLMTQENATIKQAWEAYKGMELIRPLVHNYGEAPENANYDGCNYVLFGVHNLNWKEETAIRDVYDSPEFAAIPWPPILTIKEVREFLETGELPEK